MNQPPGVVRALFLAASSLLEDLGAFVAGNVVFGLALVVAALATFEHVRVSCSVSSSAAGGS